MDGVDPTSWHWKHCPYTRGFHFNFEISAKHTFLCGLYFHHCQTLHRVWNGSYLYILCDTRDLGVILFYEDTQTNCACIWRVCGNRREGGGWISKRIINHVWKWTANCFCCSCTLASEISFVYWSLSCLDNHFACGARFTLRTCTLLIPYMYDFDVKE